MFFKCCYTVCVFILCNNNNNMNNNIFEMLLCYLCVYVVHFKLGLQIYVCGSAKIPAFSAHTVPKHVAARALVFSGNSA
jgi:hypothetical protein